MLDPLYFGINTQELAGFRMENPPNPRQRLRFMCFRTEAEIKTLKGFERIPPGGFLINTPDFHSCHYPVPGNPDGYRNDWFWIESAEILPLIAKLNVPVNTILETGDPNFMEGFMLQMQQELNRPDEFYPSSVKSIITSLLIAVLRANRQHYQFHQVMTRSQRFYYEKFCAIRDHLRFHPEQNFEVQLQAKKLNMSPGRFTVLYRSFFDISPKEDVIAFRLQKAKQLLLLGHLPIREIAEMCGWEDEHYFSRIFHRYLGQTPSQFRKN